MTLTVQDLERIEAELRSFIAQMGDVMDGYADDFRLIETARTLLAENVRLSAAWNRAVSLHTEEEAKRWALQGRLDNTEAENARLRAALEPFARYARTIPDKPWFEPGMRLLVYQTDASLPDNPTLGDCKKALEVLGHDGRTVGRDQGQG